MAQGREPIARRSEHGRRRASRTGGRIARGALVESGRARCRARLRHRPAWIGTQGRGNRRRVGWSCNRQIARSGERPMRAVRLHSDSRPAGAPRVMITSRRRARAVRGRERADGAPVCTTSLTRCNRLPDQKSSRSGSYSGDRGEPRAGLARGRRREVRSGPRCARGTQASRRSWGHPCRYSGTASRRLAGSGGDEPPEQGRPSISKAVSSARATGRGYSRIT